MMRKEVAQSVTYCEKRKVVISSDCQSRISAIGAYMMPNAIIRQKRKAKMLESSCS